MVRTDPEQPPQMVALLSNASVRSWIPELAVFERDERRRRLLDDLSAFYVAVTRAKRGLHLVMSSEPKGEYPTGAKLIRAALVRASGAADRLAGAPSIAHKYEEARVHPSEPFWMCEYAGEARPAIQAAVDLPSSAGKAASEPTNPLVELKPRAGGRAAPPSSHESHRLWALDPFTNDDIALRGVFVHECFREVESVAQLAHGEPLDALVARARRRAAAEKGAPISDALADEIRSMLAHIASERGRPGSIAASLELIAPGHEVRVLTELGFTREIDGALVNGRIDRLVLFSRAGAPVAATILDYKTGATQSDATDLANKIANYRAQLVAYGDAVAEMFTIARESIRLELLFVDRGEVVVLERGRGEP
jgi:ATP-dependent exoDNAse (exonuclease V) beta subunit